MSVESTKEEPYPVAYGLCSFIAVIGFVVSAVNFVKVLSFDTFGVQTGSVYDGIISATSVCLFLMSLALISAAAENKNFMIFSGVTFLFGAFCLPNIAPWAWNGTEQNPWMILNLLGISLWMSVFVTVLTASVLAYRLFSLPVKELPTT